MMDSIVKELGSTMWNYLKDWEIQQKKYSY